MPKEQTYAQITAQIAQLQARAEEARQREVKGVIEKIRVAVDAYNLKPSDIFGKKISTAPVAPRKKARGRKQKVTVGKYTDGNGHSWSGKGRKPQWFVEALQQGKRPEDMLATK